jgi:hypothetical protein
MFRFRLIASLYCSKLFQMEHIKLEFAFLGSAEMQHLFVGGFCVREGWFLAELLDGY